MYKFISKNKPIKYLSFFIFIIGFSSILSLSIFGQSAWPSKTWTNAVNLSASLPTDAAELSGMYWNSVTNRLYCVGDGGSVYILQYNKTTNLHNLIGSSTDIGAPEAITQVDNTLNEFYTIDESSFEIRKYTYNSSFSSFSKSKSWNLLQLPSQMTDTGNDGPEGITFVPDSYLQKISFISSVTGKAYTSVKGLGGLIFLAHQTGGYIWVFDINPAKNNDFVYVGKYKTNRSESCETAFDRSTGLLYILHNIDDNYLEVTDLTTTIVSGEFKLKTIKEYLIPNPADNTNVEGFAISPKFPENESLGVWLCRDVKKDTEMIDALRWFKPFAADGNNLQTSILFPKANIDLGLSVFANYDWLTIKHHSRSNEHYSIRIYTLQGSVIYQKSNEILPINIELNKCNAGIYVVSVTDNNYQTQTFKFVKTK